jgi:molybdate transport system ATP-binding protein
VSAAIAHAEHGENVRVVLDADDVLLATQPPTGLSARNVLAARIGAIQSAGGAARVDLELAGGERLSANVTDEALRELGLATGAHVHAVFKSSSCRVLAASVAESRAES